jgi:hypothetical protein
MVFIWGKKGYSDHIGYIIHTCSSCGQTGPFSVYQQKKKFTVYFVPTFSYSSKQFIECGACKAAYEVPKDLKSVVAENLMSQEQLSAMVRQVRERRIEEPVPEYANVPEELTADRSDVDSALFRLGIESIGRMEETLLPIMEGTGRVLSPDRAKAGYIAHSFALIWFGISANMPVEMGKGYMDRQIDMLHLELPRMGFDWTREQAEAAVGSTWTSFIQGRGSPGEQLHNVVRVILEYFVAEGARSATHMAEVVGVVAPILAGTKAVLDVED